jgi:hypothetical protein
MPPRQFAEGAVTHALLQEGFDTERLRVTDDRPWYASTNSVTIYLEMRDYGRVPFPDRPAVAKRVAAAWCVALNQKSALTRVTIADVGSGHELATLACSEATAVAAQPTRQ